MSTFVGKSAITGSFSILFIYTPELYPTNLRYTYIYCQLTNIISNENVYFLNFFFLQIKEIFNFQKLLITEIYFSQKNAGIGYSQAFSRLGVIISPFARTLVCSLFYADNHKKWYLLRITNRTNNI